MIDIDIGQIWEWTSDPFPTKESGFGVWFTSGDKLLVVKRTPGNNWMVARSDGRRIVIGPTELIDGATLIV